MTVMLPIKAVPGASRSNIAGWLGKELKVRINAPAEKGKANRSIEQLLARKLGLKTQQVRIIKGHTSAHKIVELESIDQSTLFSKLGRPPEHGSISR